MRPGLTTAPFITSLRVLQLFVWCSLPLLPLFASVQAQTSAQASAEAATLLQQSLAAQIHGAAVTDVVATGVITRQHLGTVETGTASLSAVGGGATQAVFDLPSGKVTETWSLSNNQAIISGTGPKGSSTQLAGGSILMPSPTWFAPILHPAFAHGPAVTVFLKGQEKRNGVNVQHVIAWQTPAQDSSVPAPILRQQTQSDIYLDPMTLLPVSMIFEVRPYNPAGATKPLSIRARPAPEEVRYSDYQTVQGRRVPFNISAYLGRTKLFEIQLSSVVFNTGIVISSSANGN